MEEGESSSDKRAIYNEHGFMDFIFSWSIEDILDEEFYKKKVSTILFNYFYLVFPLSSYYYLCVK
jgi:hypothetical protein